MITAIKAWYYAHVQKTIASILTAFAAIDLGSALTGYESDITSFLGAKWYAALRCLGGGVMIWRAVQATRAKSAVLPPPVVQPPR